MVARRAQELLRALAGQQATLRDDQLAAIQALVVDRRRAVVVKRTGWGKSAVYFLATRLLRDAGAGPTLLVSPLLSLMRDQIAKAEAIGIRAATINSTNLDQWRLIEAELAAGRVDLLLISPERLNNPQFRTQVLPGLSARVGLLVIDEAHCISDWGHDFRPDYRRLVRVLDDLDPDIPVLACTATANERVMADVAEQLGATPLLFRGSLDRESLRLSVLTHPQPGRPAGLAGRPPPAAAGFRDRVLPDRRGRRPGRRLAASQRDRRPGLQRPHRPGRAAGDRGRPAGRPGQGGGGHLGPGHGLRQARSGLRDPFPVAGLARSPTTSRSAGPAGPWTGPRWCCCAGPRTAPSGSGSPPPPSHPATRSPPCSTRWRRGGPMSTGLLEEIANLSRSRLELMLKVLDVEGAVRRVAGGWERTDAPWTYDADRHQRVAAARKAEQAAMLAYATTDQCLMAYLRGQLDDPDPTRCGRCANCTGQRPSPRVSPALAAEAGRFLAGQDLVLRPRLQWPQGIPWPAWPDPGAAAPPAGTGPGHPRRSRLGAGGAGAAGRRWPGPRRAPGRGGPGAGPLGLAGTAGMGHLRALPPPPQARRGPGRTHRRGRPPAAPQPPGADPGGPAAAGDGQQRPPVPQRPRRLRGHRAGPTRWSAAGR